MDASDLYSAYQSTAQENEFISRLSAGQQQSLKGYIAQQGVEEAQNLEDEIEEAFPARKVTAMLKIKVCDYLPPSVDPRWVPTEAILTIRRPAEGLVEMLKEGHRFEVFECRSDFFGGWAGTDSSLSFSLALHSPRFIVPSQINNTLLAKYPSVSETARSSSLAKWKMVRDHCIVLVHLFRHLICFQLDYPTLKK